MIHYYGKKINVIHNLTMPTCVHMHILRINEALDEDPTLLAKVKRYHNA